MKTCLIVCKNIFLHIKPYMDAQKSRVHVCTIRVEDVGAQLIRDRLNEYIIRSRVDQQKDVSSYQRLFHPILLYIYISINCFHY